MGQMKSFIKFLVLSQILRIQRESNTPAGWADKQDQPNKCDKVADTDALQNALSKTTESGQSQTGR